METINALMRTNNNNNNSVQHRTPTKKTKPKKKHAPHPVKVVYISNPMKIKTSASEFRALVQELTGQDAESPPDPARFHLDSNDSSLKNLDIQDHHHNCVVPPPLDPNNFEAQQQQEQQQQEQQQEPSSFDSFDDDVFTPQMIESISSLLPASVFYESPHLNNW